MTKDIIDKIKVMIKSHSIKEVALEVGCCSKTVWKILRSNNIKRSNMEKAAIRSRIRKNIIRAERRRAIFGLDQKSNIKVFSNKERNSLKYCMKRKGYKFPERGVNKAYITSNTKRQKDYEERGRKLGIIFITENAV